MPSLIDLRRRIRAVKSTEQITKAMKTVAASKLRRAQDRIVGARPFALLMQRVLGDLATRTGAAAAHPLLAAPTAPDAPILLFVVTADKGLCGSFNSNLVREATSFTVGAGQRGRDGVDRPQGPRLLRAARRRHPFRDGEPLQRPAVQPRRGDGRDRDRAVHLRCGVRRVDSLQRVQERVAAAGRGGPGVADPGHRRGRTKPRTGCRPTTCSSRRPSRSSRTCCRTTWRRSSSAPCSNRPRPSTRPG